MLMQCIHMYVYKIIKKTKTKQNNKIATITTIITKYKYIEIFKENKISEVTMLLAQ